MGKMIFSALLGFSLAIPLAAQTGQQAPPKDLSAWLRNSYTMNRKFIARTAEKMPEEFYGIRPGAQPEVRTFGQLIGHLANFNYRWCSDAKGEKNPMEETDFEKLTAKADLIKALDSALDLLRRRVCHAHGCEFQGHRARHKGRRHESSRDANQPLNFKSRAQQRALRQPRHVHADQEHRPAFLRAALIPGARR